MTSWGAFYLMKFTPSSDFCLFAALLLKIQHLCIKHTAGQLLFGVGHFPSGFCFGAWNTGVQVGQTKFTDCTTNAHDTSINLGVLKWPTKPDECFATFHTIPRKYMCYVLCLQWKACLIWNLQNLNKNLKCFLCHFFLCGQVVIFVFESHTIQPCFCLPNTK